MVKKLICLLAVCLLLLPCVALAESRVFDNANLFTVSEIQELEAYIAQLREDYQMDVAVLTSDAVPLNRSSDYADTFYEEHDLGTGQNHSGFMFMIDMSNRVPTITTEGDMIDLITDHRLDTLLDVGYDDLARGRYGSAAMSVLRQLRSYLREGREKGQFRYDAETGVRLTGYYNPLTPGEILLAVIAAVAVAAIFIMSVSGSYQLKGGTYRYNLADNASRTLTRDEEHFVTQRVTRHKNAPPPSSGPHSGGHSSSHSRGSAVHRSSSGRVHGGGSGRKF